jgi:formylglycine-generating enzyme required for sulfatase activity
MRWIAPARFFMGARQSDACSEDAEAPGHFVELSRPYYLDVNEVTRGQFSIFSEATRYQTEAEIEGVARGFGREGWKSLPGRTWRTPSGGDSQAVKGLEQLNDLHPVVVVTRGDAEAFAKWAGASLPTEAQFELALCAGHDEWIWPWGETPYVPPPGFGNFAGEELARFLGPGWPTWVRFYSDSFPTTAPVRSFLPNRWGFYDLSGNVMEWCSDWYAPLYYAKSPKVDPVGVKSGYQVCARGGSWCGLVETLRISSRFIANRNYRSNDIGFRLARTVAGVR